MQERRMSGIRVVAVGVLAGAALAGAGTAAADPDPGAPAVEAPAAPAADAPPDPAARPAATNNGVFDALSHPYEMFLAQAPSTAIGADPNVNPLAQSQYFNPKAYRVPGNEAENQYGLQPGVDGPFARVDGLKGTHAMLHGALGRMPAGQLSEPLPGTAPPAGTNIPVGPVGNLADPEAATVPGYGTAPVPEGSTPRLAQAAAPVEDAPPAG